MARLYEDSLPIDKKKIVFSQFGGNGYGCNLKAIADELLRRGLEKEYDLVWVLKKNTVLKNAGLPKGVRGVTSDGTNGLRELLTAKMWINNIHFNQLIDRGLVKREGTVYINTFHGGIAIKHEGTDKNTYDSSRALKKKEEMHHRDSEFVDYIISSCDLGDHVLREFFYGHGEIVRLGDARNDILINGSDELVKKVRKKLRIPDGTRIVMYAPTFRSDMSLQWYDLDYEGLVEQLESMTGTPWVMLVRLHPRLAKKSAQLIPNSPKFLDVSRYLDVQELSLISDMLISDYSSVATDYLLTRKPAFLYVPDLDFYTEQRGTYFPLDELPFSYATTNAALLKEIEGFDHQRYIKRVDEFLKKINYLEDGKSAERAVDFIVSKMQ